MEKREIRIGDRVIVEKAMHESYNGIIGTITDILPHATLENGEPIAVIQSDKGRTVRFYAWKLSLLEEKPHIWEV